MSWNHIAVGFGLVFADVIIYIILGLLLMNYDDHYSENEGEYWSLTSRSNSKKENISEHGSDIFGARRCST